MSRDENESTAWYRWKGNDLVLSLRVQPRSRHDGFGDVYGAERKLNLRAPAVDGKANAALIDYLARCFGVPKRQVSLIRGALARSKTIRINSPNSLPPALRIELKPE